MRLLLLGCARKTLVALAALGLGACSGESTGSSPPDDTDGPRWSTQGDDDDATSPTDPTNPTDTDTTVITSTGALSGTMPDSPLPLPTFAGVVGMDGSARAPADLVGHPTAMWFYPAAATGG